MYRAIQGQQDLVPGQGKVPVAPHILLETLVGFPVPVEDFYHSMPLMYSTMVLFIFWAEA